MDLNLAQYCLKIKLIIKNNPHDDDEFGGGTYTLEFEDSFYRVDGGYMIVETKKGDDIIGQIFELKSIKSYKICQ